MTKVVVITGAGISAESGIPTFRDADGLWEGHDVMEVASPIGWNKNPALVLDFYNQRRRSLSMIEPNDAHYALKRLEDSHDVHIITQNVDDLHERAGSTHVLHLHGELKKSRSEKDPTLIYDQIGDIDLGGLAEDGEQLRPDIVWFGESVPLMDKAIDIVAEADIILVIGTSLLVYPAASLLDYASKARDIYYIDPKPNTSYQTKYKHKVSIIQEKGTVGVPQVVNDLQNY